MENQEHEYDPEPQVENGESLANSAKGTNRIARDVNHRLSQQQQARRTTSVSPLIASFMASLKDSR